ncbi:hypothetical protein CDAR_397821 [Caerostris darwini]|uniref:Uncharacterized protein n=1 Tax=Caerostris darwini TaxID=1538125 RepID=A0AAV4UHI5_9ARAC|nr:hypothetical protein CDAR_397821 [Caerostris darwini]
MTVWTQQGTKGIYSFQECNCGTERHDGQLVAITQALVPNAGALAKCQRTETNWYQRDCSLAELLTCLVSLVPTPHAR